MVYDEPDNFGNDIFDDDMRRVYYHYELWEDYRSGFYSLKKFKDIDKVSYMFKSKDLTWFYMNYVIENWKYSCEQNFTNPSINQIAYLGQAASCVYCGCPSLQTMKAWKTLDKSVQERANKQSNKLIQIWKKRYLSTLKNGKKEGTQKAYQMKFLMS